MRHWRTTINGQKRTHEVFVHAGRPGPYALIPDRAVIGAHDPFAMLIAKKTFEYGLRILKAHTQKSCHRNRRPPPGPDRTVMLMEELATTPF